MDAGVCQWDAFEVTCSFVKNLINIRINNPVQSILLCFYIHKFDYLFSLFVFDFAVVILWKLFVRIKRNFDRWILFFEFNCFVYYAGLSSWKNLFDCNSLFRILYRFIAILRFVFWKPLNSLDLFLSCALLQSTLNACLNASR